MVDHFPLKIHLMMISDPVDQSDETFLGGPLYQKDSSRGGWGGGGGGETKFSQSIWERMTIVSDLLFWHLLVG